MLLKQTSTYKKLAIKHHLGKGGDHQGEVLSDSAKRQKYEKYGEEGKETAQVAPATSSMLSSVGGGKRRQETKDVVQALKVTLEQLYSGQTKRWQSCVKSSTSRRALANAPPAAA